MKTPSFGMIEPYRLGAGPNLFTDWRYVQPGMVRWDDETGRRLPLFAREGIPGQVHPMGLDIPQGISISALPPVEKTGPVVFQPTQSWVHMGGPVKVIRDAGKYRMWYVAIPTDYWQGKTPGMGTTLNTDWGALLCYAESDDLQHWVYPELGILDYYGEKTNIVYGGPMCAKTGFHGTGLFIDPSAPADERYKMFYMGRIPLEELLAYGKKLNMPVDNMAIHYNSAMFAATSPDGLHWKAYPEPVMLANSDTGNNVFYDAESGKYIAFMRMWLYGRRAVGRAVTDDFTRWPLPEPILWISPNDPASIDIYTNGPFQYPGSTSQHLMMPSYYLRDTDLWESYLFSSQDGKVWSRVPGGPVIGPGPLGNWDGGCVGLGNFLELRDGRVAMLYGGSPVPHKYPRTMRMGHTGMAIWPAERLAALESPGLGSFATPQIIFSGQHLYLNAHTAQAGEVRVEIALANELPGPVPKEMPATQSELTFEDCIPICGDHGHVAVCWRDRSSLEDYAGKPVILRFRLNAAKLFSFTFA